MNVEFNQIKQISNNLLAEVILHLPNIILAVVVLFVGILLARLSRKLIRQIILYLHRILNEKLKTSSLVIDLQSLAKYIGTAFYWITILFAVSLITQILELSFLTKWFDGLILYLPNVLAALFIIFAGFLIGKLVSDLISSIADRMSLLNASYLGNFIKYTIVFISIIIAIDQIGIDIGFLTSLVSIILGAMLFGGAFAFGLGAKTAVSNILSSHYVHKNFKVGNNIQIGDSEGVITKITSSAVFLENESGQVIIPTKNFNEQKTIIKNIT